uniref:von Willebrand factor D and EGF domain-containing protein-like n=1 Tax=Saccoglossus kowalevskii TaxID=10224 RepID=A0ABM0MJK3_SACKO|nr:PREDICTED: von Willebrand factor D and EGF domain-containing protein-like [Saccoglossus kowalevskii]
MTPTSPSCTWDPWSNCSAACGPSGTTYRECNSINGVEVREDEACNRFCYNNGTLTNGYCVCTLDFAGECCDLPAEGDVDISHSADGNDILFHCDITHQTASSSVEMVFEWFVADELVFQESISGDSARSTMDQSYWEGRMGSQIRCEVEIMEDGVSVGRKRSQQFFAGVTIDAPEVLEVYENNDAVSFNLELSIPFFCDAFEDQEEPCQVEIPLSVSDRSGRYGTYVDVVVQGQCGAQLTTENSEGPVAVTVKARRDFFSDGDGEVYLEFLPIETTHSKLWDGYKIPGTVKIITYDRDRRNRQCCGSGDPHYNTFDNMYFHVYRPGEYVYYKHEVLPYEIQTRLKKCWSVACNCGISARAEDDVIIVDKCKLVQERVVTFRNGMKSSYERTSCKLTINIIQNGDMTPGFKLVKTNGGRTYQIHFPNGAYVQASFWSSTGVCGADICFSPSSDDNNWQNGGLCGSYDGDYSNDFLKGPFHSQVKEYLAPLRNRVAHDFSDTWRVPNGNNLFYGEMDEVDKMDNTKVYCSCSPTNDGVDAQCDDNKDNGRPSKAGHEMGTCNARYCDVTNEFISVSVERQKRAIYKRDIVDDDLLFEYEEDFEPTVPAWPTPSGITEQNATDHCNALVLGSASAKACEGALTKNETDDFIENCVIDIQVLDDLDLVQSAIALLKDQCEEIVSKDTDHWQVNDDGIASLPAAIIGALCPADCSGQGTCNDGVCVCDDGYGGTDCSVHLNDAPDVYRGHENGLCDTSVETCSHVSIFGDKFVESMTCHITSIKISETGFEPEEVTNKENSVFKSFEEVQCPFEQLTRRRRDVDTLNPIGALISVSNDGTNESPQVIVIIYNDNCDVCNGTDGFCWRKPDICIVDGDCYALSDPMCQSSSNTWIIVGAVCGSVFVAIVIIVVILVILKMKGKKKTTVEAGMHGAVE